MNNLKVSQRLKHEVLTLLAKNEDRLFKNVESVEFFDQILNLRLLPSTDNRYKDARGDFFQHYINNNDWSLEYILLDRFNFLQSDEIFIKLLELTISPTVNSNQDDIQFFYHTLNPILNKENLEFYVEKYNEANLTIYRIDKINIEKRFRDIPDNHLNFVIGNNSNSTEDFLGFFKLYPTTWDDYDCENTFTLSYHYRHEFFELGTIKIINKDKVSTTSLIKDNFTQLPKDFCSLGQSIEYYKKIKEIFGTNYLTIFKSLNDAAIFTQIAEEFENTPNFSKSLIRYREQEQILRQAKYIIDNYDLKNLYSFKYSFSPKFSFSDNISISFDFDTKSVFPTRMYALIGKNGAGKTRLVTSLPLDIAKGNKELFEPRTPLFSKVIAVSYSIFDNFTIPEQSSSFNYVYCGLRTEKNGIKTTLSKDELNARFFKSISKVEETKAFKSWTQIIKNFFSEELINKWVNYDGLDEPEKLIRENFWDDLNKFSSGQAIFVYILTEILANIRYDSLIIFDEPENHLHPNAISQLINSIHDLLKEFQSFCIIATHSPIIIQSILSKNVYVVRNDENIISTSHPSIETFGENLAKITDDIFGTRDTTAYFEKELRSLVRKGYTYDEIINILQTDNIPLSLNATILLKSLVNKNV